MIHLLKMFQSVYRTNGKILLKLGTQRLNQKCTFISGYNNMKVTIVGGAGKIGKAVTLMLKQSPLIDEICLYDVKNTEGIAGELNHVDTNCKVTGYWGKNQIGRALIGSKLVVILVAAPQCNDLSLSQDWTHSAKIIQEVVNDISKYSPKAFLAIGTNPINSTVPLACELMKKNGIYNPNTIFGITTLDAVRANTFVARVLCIEPERVQVPVIGGHTEDTIVPVLSHTKPGTKFTNEELENITYNVKTAHDHMLSLNPAESAPLASSFACARFIISLVKAMKGYKDIIECAYVPSKVHPDVKYLSTPLLLGPYGISKNLGIPKLSEYERCILDNAVNCLNDDINEGEKFTGAS